MSTLVETSKIVDWNAEAERLGLTQPFDLSYFQLRGHQLVGRQHLLNRRRCILSMDKGLGKTGLILSIFEDPAVHKDVAGFTVLILCPEKGMGSFIRDIEKFPNYRNKIQLVYGNKAQRERQWRNPVAKYFICTYASFLSDVGIRTNNAKTGELATPIAPSWVKNNQIDGVVFDEYHRQFRRHKSKAFDACAKFFKGTQYCFPMSGSAVSKGPQDLWPALHIVDPRFWSTYWGYVATWCEVDDYGFGKTIIGPRADRVSKWKEAVKPYVFHCTSDMVADMPEKQRDFLDVTLPKWQRDLHNSLRDNLFAETPEGEYLFAGNTLTMINMLRQALICPKVLSPEYDVGQGIQDIHADALDGGINRYAIFTPFKAPIPILKAWLEDNGARVWVLQGGIGLDEQTRRLEAWRNSLATATPDIPSVILGTIKYAESWEIPEARYGYFLGYEWDNEDNKQAEDRLRRLISVGVTYIRYCRHLGAYDEQIIDMLLDNAANVRMMFKDWNSFRQATKM